MWRFQIDGVFLRLIYGEMPKSVKCNKTHVTRYQVTSNCWSELIIELTVLLPGQIQHVSVLFDFQQKKYHLAVWAKRCEHHCLGPQTFNYLPHETQISTFHYFSAPYRHIDSISLLLTFFTLKANENTHKGDNSGRHLHPVSQSCLLLETGMFISQLCNIHEF